MYSSDLCLLRDIFTDISPLLQSIYFHNNDSISPKDSFLLDFHSDLFCLLKLAEGRINFSLLFSRAEPKRNGRKIMIDLLLQIKNIMKKNLFFPYTRLAYLRKENCFPFLEIILSRQTSIQSRAGSFPIISNEEVRMRT